MKYIHSEESLTVPEGGEYMYSAPTVEYALDWWKENERLGTLGLEIEQLLTIALKQSRSKSSRD